MLNKERDRLKAIVRAIDNETITHELARSRIIDTFSLMHIGHLFRVVEGAVRTDNEWRRFLK